MAIALGGCISANPRLGITEDSGGHITYILGAMQALADRPDISSAEIVTRRFDDAKLGPCYAQHVEQVSDTLRITRIDSGNPGYLTKADLAHDRTAFAAALIAELERRPRLPDIIHAHFADAAEIAAMVREALGIPFVYTAHSLGIDKLSAMGAADAGLDARIEEERRAMAAADAIIGSSRDECERQLPAYGSAVLGKVHRIMPGIDQQQADAIDIANAQALIAPFLRDPDRPMILAIARPVAKKNLATLVEAFAALRSRANLVLLPGIRQSIEDGEPEQVQVMRGLTDAIDAHDLHGSVAYPRQHDAGIVRGLYALAARTGGVFVNPALIEPFGLTILEAAVHGLPVVATCRGGPVDIIGDLKHGLLVDPRSPDGITDAIDRLLQDRALWERCAANARENITQVQWSRYAKGFHAVAQSIVSPPVKRSSAAGPHGLLICDIDHTLTGDGAAAERFAAYLSARPDMLFGVATGRSLVEARRIMREWFLPEPSFWITAVGSELHWPVAGRLIPDSDYSAALDADWFPAQIRALADDIDGLTLQAAVDQRAHKISYFANRAAADRLRDALGVANLRAHVIFSHGRLLDILPQQAGKAAAMRHVAQRLGVALRDVIVAGDSGNDRDMILSGCNAIVVANAEPEMLALSAHPQVYLAQQAHAAGVMEGVDYWSRAAAAVPLRRSSLKRLERAA